MLRNAPLSELQTTHPSKGRWHEGPTDSPQAPLSNLQVKKWSSVNKTTETQVLQMLTF